MSRVLAIQLDEETFQRLSFNGETASLTKHQLVEKALRSHSREKEQYIKAVQQGQGDICAQRVISHKDLVTELSSHLADLY